MTIHNSSIIGLSSLASEPLFLCFSGKKLPLQITEIDQHIENFAQNLLVLNVLNKIRLKYTFHE